MSADENRATYRRFVDEVIVKGNLGAIDELLDPGFVEHEPLPPGFAGGRDGVKQLFSMVRGGFSDLQVTFQRDLVEGDTVACLMSWTGTHTGEFLGIPPTKKQVSFDVFDLVRVRDGKLVEHWGVTDQFGLLQQLGAIPQPGQATG